MKILITSGGTTVKIDEVRRISNMSTGRFGAELARAFLEYGHEVIFLYAKNSRHPFNADIDWRRDGWDIQLETLRKAKELWAKYPMRLTSIEYSDYDEYAELLRKFSMEQSPDITVLAAAVSDYGTVQSDGKISSDQDELLIRLTRLPKLINYVKTWSPKTYLVGFKLLVGATAGEIETAIRKQKESAGIDMCVGNDLKDIRNGNHVLTTLECTTMSWGMLFGDRIAHSLARDILQNANRKFVV